MQSSAGGSGTGLGTAPGVAGFIYSADHTASGLHTLIYGESRPTYLKQAAVAVGVNPTVYDFADGAAGFLVGRPLYPKGLGDDLLKTNNAAEASEISRISQARQRQGMMLEDNVGYNISPLAWDKYPTIGRNGTFISDQKGITDIIGDFSANSKMSISQSKIGELESAFGLEAGTLADGFKIRRIDNITNKLTRSPLEGNQYFLGPGNHLPGGAPEMVIDSIPTVDTKDIRTILRVLSNGR